MNLTALWSMFVAVIAVLFFSRCAREVVPSGGLIDTLPPRILRMKPENKTVNFTSKKVVLYFDEFVSLKSITDNLIISPPSDPKPEIRQSGKRLIIDFSACSLADSTTYSLNFGSSIADLNEGNVSAGLSYIFSTGPNLDSLHVKGRIRNVQNGELIPSMTAALYRDLNDSAPLQNLPNYIAKSGADGCFLFNTVGEGSYRLIVFDDANRNMKFDSKAESVAFCDSLLSPSATNTVRYDTLHSRDTILFHADKKQKHEAHIDTMRIDSVVKVSETVFLPNPVELFLFVPNTNVQFVKSFERQRREKVLLVFNQPLFDDSISVSLRDSGFSAQPFALRMSPTKDSATLWVTDSALLATDTASFLVRYKRYDSLNQKYSFTDTITPRYNIRKDKFKGFQSFLFAFNARNSASILPDGSIDIESSLPMTLADDSKIRLYTTIDTVGLKNRHGAFYQIDTSKTEVIAALQTVKQKRYKPDSAYKDQHVVQYRYVPNRFMLRFGLPVDPSDVQVSLVQMPELKDWCVTEFNAQENTLYAWITNAEALRYISPQILVRYRSVSGAMAEQSIILRKGKPGKKRKSARESKQSAMLTKQQQEEHFIDELVEVIFADPLVSIDTARMSLTLAGDTTMAKLPASFALDTLSKRKLLVGYKWKKNASYILSLNRAACVDIYGNPSRDFMSSIKTQASARHKIATPVQRVAKQDSVNELRYRITAKWDSEKNYRLVVADSAFTDIFGKYNDSTETDFTVMPAKNLSSLEVRIKHAACPLILEVMDKEMKTVLFRKASADTGQVVFSFGMIRPSVYGFRIVEDMNNNKKWDTGDYFSHIQPEKMRFSKDLLETKANKDHIFTWDLADTKSDAEPINKQDADKKSKSANAGATSAPKQTAPTGSSAVKR